MQSGQTDIEHEPWVEDYLALKDDAKMEIGFVVTGQCPVIRMRADIPPFDNVKLRQALKLCQKREELLKKAYYGQGSVGQDCHVAPVHPDYAPVDTPPYDPEKARQLLMEAGYPDGIDVELTCGADFPLDVAIAESLKADADPRASALTSSYCPVPNTGTSGPRRRSASPTGHTAPWAPWCSTSPIRWTRRASQPRGTRRTGWIRSSSRC